MVGYLQSLTYEEVLERASRNFRDKHLLQNNQPVLDLLPNLERGDFFEEQYTEIVNSELFRQAHHTCRERLLELETRGFYSIPNNRNTLSFIFEHCIVLSKNDNGVLIATIRNFGSITKVHYSFDEASCLVIGPPFGDIVHFDSETERFKIDSVDLDFENWF